MFKEALSALSTSLVGAVKDTASEYKPTAQNMGGAFTRIAQQGIANLSFRSPILADMAATMLHNFQHELVNRDTVKQYVASDKSEELRKEIETKLGKDASKEKVDKEMFKILDKMRTLVDREGEKAAKSSDTFKEYGKFFEKFAKDMSPSQSAPTQQGGSSAGGLGSDAEARLAHIDANTEKTVKLLGDISLGEGVKPATGVPMASTGATPQGNSYVDPYTGLPSIGASISGIGGNFLAKIFDDDMLSKYAGKARAKLFGEKESTEEVKKPDQISGLITPEFRPKDLVKVAPAPKPVSDVASILGDLSLDLTSSSGKSVENERENDVQDEKKHTETKTLQEKTVDELKALHETTKANGEKSGGIFSTIMSLVGSVMPMIGMVGPALAAMGPILAGAAKVAGAAGAVTAAGAAGYAVGDSLVKPLIDRGIQTVTGEKDATLGTKLHEWFSGDDGKVAELLKSTPPTIPKQSSSASVNTVAKLEDKKTAAEAKTNQQTTVNPVAINSTTNNNSSTNVIVGSSVRNHESTYERVQMSNIWGPI